MASIRRRILTAVVTQLNVVSPAGVPVAALNRTFTHDLAELPALTVYSVREDGEVVGGGKGPITRRQFAFACEALASGDAIEDALDPILVHVTKQLNGQRLSEGGAVITHEVQESTTEWEFEQLEVRLGRATIEFVVGYQTLTADLEATK